MVRLVKFWVSLKIKHRISLGVPYAHKFFVDQAYDTPIFRFGRMVRTVKFWVS